MPLARDPEPARHGTRSPAEMREQAQELRNNAATWVEALEAGELAVMSARVLTLLRH